MLLMLSQVVPFSGEDTITYPLSHGIMQLPLINILSARQDVQLLLVAKQFMQGAEQLRHIDLVASELLFDDINVPFGQLSRQLVPS